MAVKMNPFIFYLIFVAFTGGDAAVMMQATQATLDLQLRTSIMSTAELDYRTRVVGQWGHSGTIISQTEMIIK